MNKFDLINTVLLSKLKPEDKALLVELLMRWNKETGQCNPSVERLCKARGIKHEKNFKGADVYLPGLVTAKKVGRKNYYTLNIEAIAALDEFEVTIKHTNTPAVEGVYTPAVEGVLEVNTPAVADNTPAVEGANSTTNNTTTENKRESTTTVADAPVVILRSSLSKENLDHFSFYVRSSFAKEVPPVFDTNTHARQDRHYWQRLQEENAAERRRQVQLDMGYDPEGVW